MSHVNTVTISIDDFQSLKNKARAIDEVLSNPDAYLVFEVNNHWAFGISKNFAGVDHGLLNSFRRENEALQKRVYELEAENKHLDIIIDLANQKKPWYKFW